MVHEFVQNGGLQCLIQLGRKADQNHQNYILRGHFLSFSRNFIISTSFLLKLIWSCLELSSLKKNSIFMDMVADTG